ncbi:ABATE domain-containing protein [Streptomyces sp. NPDC021562]|uniref:CGNR zinc finger domain-containing protein n=1 Tax=Streptomyces sp. NPDC021562 TaxID=3155121 RepID=UPI0033FB5E02
MHASTELRFDAGRLCLDLLATVGARLSPSPVERLDSDERLADWLHRSGLVPDDEPLTVNSDWRAGFTALRGRLHRIVHTALRGEEPTEADIAQLNLTAAAGRPTSRLVRGERGRMTRRLAHPPCLDQLLAAVADDAIRLLSSPERRHLRVCEGPTCDMVYLDTSRGQRRRWCSASACGNRHYVAAHRARKADRA